MLEILKHIKSAQEGRRAGAQADEGAEGLNDEREIKGSEIDAKKEDEDEDEEEEEEEEEASNLSLTAFKNLPALRLRSQKSKQFLFFWHILMLFLSLSMIGLGFYLTLGTNREIYEALETSVYFDVLQEFVRTDLKPPPLTNFSKLIAEFAWSIHLYGWTFLVSTMLYISFFYHRFTFTWPILSLFTLISVVLYTSNVLVRLAPANELSVNMQKSFKEALKDYQIHDSKPTSLEFDYVSIWGHCCGITSKYDFQMRLLKYKVQQPNGEDTVANFQVPATCCNGTALARGIKGVVECASRAINTYNVSCFQTIYNIFHQYRSAYLVALILMLLDVFIHAFMYYRMVGGQRKQYRYRDLLDLERKRQAQWDY